MSDIRDMLAETAERLFADHCTRDVVDGAEKGVWAERLWQALQDAGLTSIPLGSGAGEPDLVDAVTVMRIAGRNAAPVPLAETMLACWLAEACGFEAPSGPLTVASAFDGADLRLGRVNDIWLLNGTAKAVPWASRAGTLAVMARHGAEPWVALVPSSAAGLAAGRNLAGEPRDELVFASVELTGVQVAPCPPGVDLEQLWLRGALCRAAAMAGALEKVLALTVGYAGERVQFGRALGKFQAVQQQIAVLAGAVAASGVAVEAAAEALCSGDGRFAVAAAKARVGEAATQAAAIAHQIHGAMGFTQEHELHLSTRRLWSWREEFGDESYWWDWLGHRVADGGVAGLWPLIVGGETDLQAKSGDLAA